MFAAYEQDLTERCFFFAQDSNGASKNECASQNACLQPHFSVKYKRWK